MQKYVIEGNYPIKGKIKASGNKNAALPCLAATLLTDKPVILKNIPEIEDVHVMLDILKLLGSDIKQIKKNEYRIITNNIKKEEIPRQYEDSSLWYSEWDILSGVIWNINVIDDVVLVK